MVNNTFEDTVDTTTATTAPDDPQPMVLSDCKSNVGEHSVWYYYEPTADISLYVDTIGSNYDTLLAVWKYSAGTLTLIACNDDDDQFIAGASKTGFFAQSGSAYYIEIIQYTSPAGAPPTEGASGRNP